MNDIVSGPPITEADSALMPMIGIGVGIEMADRATASRGRRRTAGRRARRAAARRRTGRREIPEPSETIEASVFSTNTSAIGRQRQFERCRRDAARRDPTTSPAATPAPATRPRARRSPAAAAAAARVRAEQRLAQRDAAHDERCRTAPPAMPSARRSTRSCASDRRSGRRDDAELGAANRVRDRDSRSARRRRPAPGWPAYSCR